MEQSGRPVGFFTWVWRLNGLLVLVLALAGLVGVLLLAVDAGMFARRDRPEQNLAHVAGTDLRANDLRLSDFYPIEGSQLLYARLGSPSEYSGSGSGGGQSSTRNVLIFDTTTKKAHWLLPGNEQTIESFSFLADQPAKDAHPVTTAILFEVHKDSRRSLSVAAPDGSSISKIADPVEGVLGFHEVRKDSVFVFYVSAGSARVLELDPVTRVVRSDDLLSSEVPDGATSGK